jgi:hypothetical protein
MATYRSQILLQGPEFGTILLRKKSLNTERWRIHTLDMWLIASRRKEEEVEDDEEEDLPLRNASLFIKSV